MLVGQVHDVQAVYAHFIQEHGGRVVNQEYWGLRTLAYSIEKNRKAHYLFFAFELPVQHNEEFQRRLKLNEDIVRFLMIKVDQVSSSPTPLAMREFKDEASDENSSGDASNVGSR